LISTLLSTEKNDRVEDDESFNPVDLDKKEEEFRNYQDGPRQKKVANFYHLNHRFQALDYVLNMKEKIKFQHLKMTIWEAFEVLDTIVDDSDPDTNLPQIYHGLQTAEASRKEFPDLEWLHLACLIHDLGKVLCLPCFGLEQWAIVGDTFPVGCRFSDKNIFPEFFVDNPDALHPVYSTELGIYQKNCGIMNLHMSFGHDEYLYQVLAHNKTNLPLEAMYILRFHSFYPLHHEGAYMQFMTSVDEEMLKWIKTFNRFDLYSKSHEIPNLQELKAYYSGLVDKYIPGVLYW